MKFGAMVLMGWLLASVAVAGAREVQVLPDQWRFQAGDVPGGAHPGTDDARWTALSLPHNWGWEQGQRGDEKYRRGPGWYRRSLNLKPSPGRRYFIRFGAAGSVADVYLNGAWLRQHRGAFGAF